MRKAIALIFVLALVGCDKKDNPAAATTATAAKPAASPASTPSAPASAAASAAPSAAPSASAGGLAEAAEDQEGLEKGEVVVGWLTDEKDEGQCIALPAP